MKGFSLDNLNSPVIEPILCICLTEEKGKFLVCGMRKGHLLVYNRQRGGKKIIEDVVKKGSDILCLIDLELLHSKYFLIQDSRFYLRMYSADFLYYHNGETNLKPHPVLEISQKPRNHEDQLDIYSGDGKCIELVTTEFASNKHRNITFILSIVSSLK